MHKMSKIQQSGIDVTIKSIAKIRYGEENENLHPSVEGNYWLINGCYDINCNEYVNVPQDMCAILIIRSTFNRLGAFITTGLYDNGFSNYIGTVLHVRAGGLNIKQDERIAQIVFMRSEGRTLYEGQYQDPSIERSSKEQHSGVDERRQEGNIPVENSSKVG